MSYWHGQASFSAIGCSSARSSAERSSLRSREFARIGTVAAAARKLWKRASAHSASEQNGVAVAGLDEIPTGGSKLFRYPTNDDVCILLRLPDDKFVAFSQNCTHLNCPVHFDSQSSLLLCPCHQGFFDASDGRPIAGPPRRALASFGVTVRDNKIWVTS